MSTDAAVSADAVVLDDVSVVRGGRTVWSEGSFRVPRGAVVIVIGPNGSGKTTLLQLMLGLLEPSAGAVSVLGATPTAGSPRVGYVPQNYTANIGMQTFLTGPKAYDGQWIIFNYQDTCQG